ncbi:TSUP family transporter [Helicobacter baculiformis]|uniref:Probable membrane transporter protein n=1 Tax=Helicobacter baculiformis TaxID=427351 RepID=A0ABV7ZII8_9HELI|nr:TSUP family transporter [Helicobacter baculiformis]
MELEWYVYGIFFVAAFSAGLVDSIAGGGGLITVPTLMALGIPPHMVLATNKLQSSFGSFTAALNFCLKGMVPLREVAFGVGCVVVGAALGTTLILWLKADMLRVLIPIFLSLIFIYTLLAPKVGEGDSHPRVKPALFYGIFGLGLGFYDGFFGPGTGSFWTFAMVALLGLNMKKATARTKVFNFTSNIVSLSVFLMGGEVIWSVGLLMGAGQMLGAWVGSNLVMAKEVKFIRRVFLCVVGATILKLFWDFID